MPDAARVSSTGEVFDLSRVEDQLVVPNALSRGWRVQECRSLKEMERFVSARDSLPERLKGFLVHYSIVDFLRKDARVFLTEDARGGFALMEGELGSLFSLPGAHYGNLLVELAVEKGAHKLSCYDCHGKLPSMYGRHGFKETFRAEWDNSLAPSLWNYELWGRPDYVEMSR